MAEALDLKALAQSICPVSDIMHRALAETPEKRQCDNCTDILKVLTEVHDHGHDAGIRDGIGALADLYVNRPDPA